MEKHILKFLKWFCTPYKDRSIDNKYQAKELYYGDRVFTIVIITIMTMLIIALIKVTSGWALMMVAGVYLFVRGLFFVSHHITYPLIKKLEKENGD